MSSTVSFQTPPVSDNQPRARRRWPVGLLTVPLVAYLVIVLIIPIGVVLSRSFSDPSVGIANYQAFFTSDLYLRVLGRTFMTSAIVTVAALCIGYPYAYLMTLATPFWRAVMLITVLVPFWTSLLVRSFALVILLRDTGVVNKTLMASGLVDAPLPLIRSDVGVWIGMIQILLPFMVLPLYVVMRDVDLRLLDAAHSLGSRPAFAFWRIFVPLTRPGIAAGVLLVFIQALGFYITPALLGGPQNAMLGELIVEQISTQLRWGFAATIAMILLLSTLVVLAIANRFTDVRSVLMGRQP